jgi:Transglycosylase SLT domain
MLATSKWRASFDADTAALGFPNWRGYPPGVWLEALCMHESSGNPDAMHVDEPGWLTTSYGLFQIEGSTAVGLLPGLTGPSALYHPVLNRALALAVLALWIGDYLGSNPNPPDDQIDRVIAAYNGGAWGAGYKEIVGLTGRGPLADQAYVDAVLAWCPKVQADRA